MLSPVVFFSFQPPNSAMSRAQSSDISPDNFIQSSQFNYHLYTNYSQIDIPSLDLYPELHTCIFNCLFELSTWICHRHVQNKILIFPPPQTCYSCNLSLFCLYELTHTHTNLIYLLTEMEVSKQVSLDLRNLYTQPFLRG